MADTNITADPVVVTTTQLGNRLVNADPILLTAVQRGDPVWGTPFVRDPELDITFDCQTDDHLGNEGVGVIKLVLTPLGTYINITIFSDPIEVTTTQEGDFVECVFIASDAIELTLELKISEVLTELFKKNWVKWSNIGYLDFTIWKDNIAGERPLDWKGWVYEIKKFMNRVIVYGENGVSILPPVGNTYGLYTVNRLGLKGKQAVAGDESTHFFIDKEGELWVVGETSPDASRETLALNRLGYSEYLSALSNPVLSWDPKNQLLYICDGTLGFIYSQDSKSLGKGPSNITGLGYQGGTLYIVAPITVSTPTFELWTDIHDMGTRKGKSISSLEIGVDLTTALKAAIRHRQDKSASFSQTDWATINAEGKAFIQCYGQEFQFGLKADTYEYFELDYIKANGRVYESW